MVAASGERIDVSKLADKKQLPALMSPNGTDSLAFSADGRFLFGASQRGTVSIWAMPSGRLEASIELQSVASGVAISATGLADWLGPVKTHVDCRIGARLDPVELCEERYLAPGLLRAVLSGPRLQALAD